MFMLKQHLKSIWNFFLTYLKSLNPVSYIDLSQRMHRNMLHYFFSLIFVAVVAFLILSLPKLIFLNSYVDKQFDKFEELEINIDSEMSSPIVITDSDPLIAIDTAGNLTDIRNLPVKLLITEKKLQFKSSFATVHEIDISGYSNILQHKAEFKKLITYMIIIALPTILVMLFILFSLKYLIIILITVPIAFAISRALRSEIRFRSIIRIAFYSSTSVVTIDILAMIFGLGEFLYAIPFILGLDLYLVSLIVFAFYISMAMVLVAARELYNR